ncbi:MAG: bifunctional folylpolyglutamate synthase/dihydrofolate synthase [Microbacteriaceae bacterium]
MSDEKYWATKAQFVEDELVKRIPENKLRPRLEPTRRAVELLGDPQKTYRVIHVTGTNGKTSTTRFIERILREYGLRTGRFTSPHLVSLNERISLDGEPVSNETLFAVYTDIAPILEIVDAELEAAGDTKLTFFEALAVLGFAVFADAPVDVLVLEVGMGGEWDSTNVADGDVAVFTPIDLDHTERLGETIREIAATKSGIIKPESIVVSSTQHPDALSVLQEKAQTIAQAAKFAPENFSVESVGIDGQGQRVTVSGLAGRYENLYLPLYGSHQAENLALAIAAVESFLGGGETLLNDEILRIAVADFSSPGRLQVISREPLTILDAAHNPHGAASLAASLVHYFGSPNVVAVIGVLADKDAEGVLQELAPVVDHVIVTKSSSPRALPVEDLSELAIKHFGADRVSSRATLAEALKLAHEVVVDDGAILVTGSVSMVGDVLKDLRMEEDEE